MELPAALRDTLDSKAFAHVATLDPDGTPQVSVMWIMREGDHIVLNTAQGRRKWRNLERDRRVGISISPLDAAYENWSIQGRVVDMRTTDGVEVIDELARKYTNSDRYQGMKPGMIRVTLIVEVERVAHWG